MMDWGLAIPNEYQKDFRAGKPLDRASSRDVEIIWDRKRYSARLCHFGVKQAKNPMYHLRWDNNQDLLRKIRKTFIQSYVILKSQKELFDAEKKEGHHFRTRLTGGQQEVLMVQPLSPKEILFKVFIRIENEWNSLFERLADENVFGWLFDKEKRYLISRSTHWIKSKDFNKHQHATNVIYYLAHTKRKLIYVGKAETLGKRVKPGRQHQKMPGDWDKFKYDIVKPEYSRVLDKIEDHTIRAFASILQNANNYPTLGLSNYELVNSNWRRL